ncbi:hypothetical protein GGF46_005087 [Coemansia sp. RSA 552]|nr:hypothetical protein GGF46_005087 [Coemansia sp. RSA 552]
MTATVSLANYWTWSGGVAQYVSWATSTDIPYPVQWDPLNQVFAGGDYTKYLDYTNRFYADDSIYNITQSWFKQHIKAVVSRVNTVSGLRYCDDPGIMAWELMNEPQIITDGGDGEARLFQWIDESAAYIRQLDANHLITTGAESKNGPTWFNTMHKSRYITLASCHFWPLNWGYYNATDPTETSVDYSISKMQYFVDDVAQMARSLDMPVVLFEYGMVRDNWGENSGLDGYKPSAPVTHRNRFYSAVAQHMLRAGRDGPFAGSAFWAYAGIARPPSKPTAELTWTGDPPHEPPGWNSVYDQDTDTLDIIRRSNKHPLAIN